MTTSAAGHIVIIVTGKFIFVEPLRLAVIDVRQTVEPGCLVRTAGERRLSGDAVPAVNRDCPAEGEKTPGEARLRVTKNLGGAVIWEPRTKRIDGSRQLQVPAGRAVDPRDFLEHLERGHGVDFQPAQSFGTPHSI